MKPFSGVLSRLDHITNSSFSIRTLATAVGIAIGIIIALHALTVNPNDLTTTIGFPP
jgi:small-conductance mechanosensitive channel